MSLNLVIQVDSEMLKDAIVEADRFDALSAIVAIDLAIADFGFTVSLIKRLAASIRGDMTANEYAELLTELAKEIP